MAPDDYSRNSSSSGSTWKRKLSPNSARKDNPNNPKKALLVHNPKHPHTRVSVDRLPSLPLVKCVTGTTFTVVGSTVFAVSPPGQLISHPVPSSSVFFFDTASASDWVQAPPLTSLKSCPLVLVVGGKLVVASDRLSSDPENDDHLLPKPWFEFLDTCLPRSSWSWSPLPDPTLPSCVNYASYIDAYAASDSQVFFSVTKKTSLSYSFVSSSWDIRPRLLPFLDEARLCNGFYYGFPRDPSCAGRVYMYSQGEGEGEGFFTEVSFFEIPWGTPFYRNIPTRISIVPELSPKYGITFFVVRFQPPHGYPYPSSGDQLFVDVYDSPNKYAILKHFCHKPSDLQGQCITWCCR